MAGARQEGSDGGDGMSSTVSPPRPASTRRQGWRDRAACRGVDPELFFPGEGGAGAAAVRKSAAICAGCEVRAECLQFALSSPEQHGTWGGLSERERRGMDPAAKCEREQEGIAA